MLAIAARLPDRFPQNLLYFDNFELITNYIRLFQTLSCACVCPNYVSGLNLKEEHLDIMSKTKLTSLIVGAVAIIGLSGCDQLEQAATEAVDKAKQTAVNTLDEARQAGSIEEAKQSADNALQDVRQQAAGLLQQASEILSGTQPAPDEMPPGADAEPMVEPRTDG